ncbi:4'-phosphopantetheinyl transferase superfamily protein [Salipiger sp. P9]|uniref:4'-phosphopantetheinyl transferase family protein n=1 Tax=Salipiger pentaromativorans TaxID=2943193 RepID=UPI002157E1BF|nr:4'-phosphopantetheinyl transferase superfamily protein [Salipiger pentaromativorans]MCR8549101.1 4'-phosphopantetheinyl transferase superfamily protein [Salipiger pentaromativorans]
MSPERLSAALARSGLPAGLGWAICKPTSDPGALFPEERAALRNALPTRVAEFAGGRRAARQAMAQLGLAPQAIPMAPDRAPVWPEGLVGSITHSAGNCLALVGRASDWHAIGADLEPDADLPADIISEIATPEELLRLAPIPPARAAARLFSAKEAAYKAQYPLTQSLFGFDAMQGDLVAGQMRMVAEIGLGKGALLPMRQKILHGLILSLCLIPAKA